MDEIYEGMGMILKYEPDADMSAEHDTIYCGSFENTESKMSVEERARMEKLGWFADEETDSWLHFV